MLFKKRIDIVLISILVVLVSLFFCSCSKSTIPSYSEHTYSINKNTVFIKIFPPNSTDSPKKEISIVIFVKEDDNIDETRSFLNDFSNDGYTLVFLRADWVSIFHGQSNSISKDENKNLICNMLNDDLTEDKKIFLLTGELGCFTFYPAIQSDCSEGLILLSPYCNSDNSVENKIQNSLYTPTFISVGENDIKSYNFSLQLYQKNRSFCEMRTYPTDEEGWVLLNSSIHAKEQMKLWIETIMSKGN